MESFWVATIKTITLEMTWEHTMLMMSSDFSLWDAAGHTEYHVTHGMFLDSNPLRQ